MGSDHSAFTRADKRGAADFTAIPQGIPGVGTRITPLHDAGVRTGRLSLERLVELVSSAFGLWPRKGAVRAGSDADLVVFDPAHRERISAATHGTSETSVDFRVPRSTP